MTVIFWKSFPLLMYLYIYLIVVLTFYAVLQEGFYYHHAEPNYLMLVHWLPKTANTIPANATHRVGVGAFVMNEKSEVID